jgi:hypothetical protein
VCHGWLPREGKGDGFPGEGDFVVGIVEPVVEEIEGFSSETLVVSVGEVSIEYFVIVLVGDCEVCGCHWLVAFWLRGKRDMGRAIDLIRYFRMDRLGKSICIVMAICGPWGAVGVLGMGDTGRPPDGVWRSWRAGNRHCGLRDGVAPAVPRPIWDICAVKSGLYVDKPPRAPLIKLGITSRRLAAYVFVEIGLCGVRVVLYNIYIFQLRKKWIL